MTAPPLPADRRIGLCFHGIGTRQRVLESDEEGYWVSRDQFLAIVDEVAGWPSVDISLDDGNASDVEIALPALQERGLTATFYALAGRLDQRGSLGAEELGALAAAGMEIGTHGWNHVPWPGLDAASFRHEVSEARARLADVVGRPVTKAALPLGQYDRRVLQGLRDAAYESVSTSDRALARSGSWLLPRFSVHATDSVASMRATVTAAIHPWSRVTSSAKQAVKRLR